VRKYLYYCEKISHKLFIVRVDFCIFSYGAKLTGVKLCERVFLWFGNV